ncbi:hypothetical protein [Aquibacillus salsiterrae]|uniref:Uncharacterized protein n=1 Tax=Aquibacillus salsiterrae TaxID=2950439 RepID=A0A9X4AET0_9BACI|nr:hypothetical protein [Aquibacillus salsiterrae]MDC3415510.1 hypothetical protein [Aquibacillus salsiterrae]
MKFDCKGFLLTEVLVCLSIFSIIIFTLIPIIKQVRMDEYQLSLKREIELELHDQLQYYLWAYRDITLPITISKKVKMKEAYFTINQRDNLLEGCVEWQNEDKTTKRTCLYGYPSK